MSERASGSSAPVPVLRVVRGSATPEEVAVLLALAAARGGAVADVAPMPRGGWSDPARRLGISWRPGPGAWRAR